VSTRIELTHASVLFSGREEGDLGRSTGVASDPQLASRAGIVGLCGTQGVAIGAQVHGHVVARVEGGVEGYVLDASESDGQVTAARGVAVGVHTADCLPIAVAGEGGVAMLHGGWRGLAAGIVADGVATLRSLGVDGRLEAVIGPGAGGCCYETGPEVHAVFASYGASDGRRIDLAAIASAQLREAGVEAIRDVAICTICAPEGLLFSHRRDGPDTGRQGGFAWLR
jgi:polyphenol oxidase